MLVAVDKVMYSLHTHPTLILFSKGHNILQQQMKNEPRHETTRNWCYVMEIDLCLLSVVGCKSLQKGLHVVISLIHQEASLSFQS